MFSLYILDFILTIRKFINGIKVIGINEKLKVVSYCDDVTIFCDGPEDIKNVIKIISEFEEMTGSNISREKSYIFDLKINKVKSYGDFVGVESKILGIFFGRHNGFKRKQQVEEIIDSIQGKIKKAGIYSSNFLSKAILVNSVLLPKLIYVSSFTEITKRQIVSIKRIISKYIWKEKRLRLSYIKMTFPLNVGGFNLKDVKTLIENVQIRSLYKYVFSLSKFSYMDVIESWAIKDIFVKRVSCKFRNFYGKSGNINELLRYRKLYNEILKNDITFNCFVKKHLSFSFIKNLSLSSNLIDFIIKCELNILPTKVVLIRRNILKYDSDFCEMCNQKSEDMNHIFGLCIRYKFIICSLLYQCGINIHYLFHDHFSIMMIFHRIRMVYRKWFILVLYSIWCQRCSRIFDGKEENLQDIIERKIKIEFLLDFQRKEVRWLKEHWPINLLRHLKGLGVLVTYLLD